MLREEDLLFKLKLDPDTGTLKIAEVLSSTIGLNFDAQLAVLTKINAALNQQQGRINAIKIGSDPTILQERLKLDTAEELSLKRQALEVLRIKAAQDPAILKERVRLSLEEEKVQKKIADAEAKERNLQKHGGGIIGLLHKAWTGFTERLTPTVSVENVLGMAGRGAMAAGRGLAGAAGSALVSPLGGVEKLLGGLAGAAGMAVESLGKLGNMTAGFVGAFNPAIVDLFNLSMQNLTASLGPIFQPFVEGLTVAADILNELFTSLQGTFEPILRSLSGVFISLVRNLAESVRPALEALAPILVMVVQTFSQINAALAPVRNELGLMFAELLDAVAPLVPVLIELVLPPLRLFAQLLTFTVRGLRDLVQFLFGVTPRTTMPITGAGPRTFAAQPAQITGLEEWQRALQEAAYAVGPPPEQVMINHLASIDANVASIWGRMGAVGGTTGGAISGAGAGLWAGIRANPVVASMVLANPLAALWNAWNSPAASASSASAGGF